MKPTDQTIPGGVVHDLPHDFADALKRDPAASATWRDITPLPRIGERRGGASLDGFQMLSVIE